MTTSTQPAAGTKAASGAGEMCRLTICGPSSRIEIAVPVHVPLADLMPTLLGHLDPALSTSGLGHDGWVLQRLGEPPLDEDLATSTLGLLDGDVLHLRPRDDQIPMVAFDDVVDGVHTGLSARPDRWRPELTRRLLLMLAGGAVLVALGALLTAGAGEHVAVLAGALGLLLVAAAGGATRALGDTTAGLVLAGAGAGFAAVAGLATPAVAGAPLVSGPSLLSAFACLAVAAFAGRFAVGVDSALTPVGGAAATGAGASLLAVLTGAPPAGVAAVAFTVSALLTRLAPVVAARLAGISVDPVPTSHTEFQQGIDPKRSDAVLAKAAKADRYLTVALRALGLVNTGALVTIAATPGWACVALALAGALMLALQSRELAATAHRLAALLPALAAVFTLAGALAATDAAPRPVVVLGGVAAACALLATARSLPGARIAPRWGRWGDLLHWASAIAVVPLGLAVLGVYGWIHDLWG
jgi:type VII secretion integral membrane protein EccD